MFLPKYGLFTIIGWINIAIGIFITGILRSLGIAYQIVILILFLYFFIMNFLQDRLEIKITINKNLECDEFVINKDKNIEKEVEKNS